MRVAGKTDHGATAVSEFDSGPFSSQWPPLLPGITEQLVDCSGGNEVSEESGFQRKAAALFAVLQEQRAPRAIVFCNKIESCESAGDARTYGASPPS